MVKDYRLLAVCDKQNVRDSTSAVGRGISEPQPATRLVI